MEEATETTSATKITLEELCEAFDYIRGCSDLQYKRTPLLAHWKDVEGCVELSRRCDLYFKLENMQVSGANIMVSSFLIRHHL